MFGSKLRSWMENHIGRPRKKAAKNKTANSAVSGANAVGCSHEAYQLQSSNNKKISSSNSGAIFTLHHAHGNGASSTSPSITANNSSTSAMPTMTTVIVAPGAMSSFGANHHNGGSGSGGGGGGGSGCGSVIASPVRRREVSPIQGHTQSRYGWQSPDQETVTSPKSDNFLYAPQHRVRNQSHYSNHQQQQPQQRPYTAPNSSKDNSSDDRSLQAKSYTHSYSHHFQPQQHQQQKQRQTQTQQNTTKIQQQPHPADCSSSSISSLSWSTGSKEPSMNSSSNHNNNNTNHSSSNNNSSISKLQPPERQNNSANDLRHYEEDPNIVHYEEIRTILRHPEHHCSSSYNNNNNNTNPFLTHERPKSEQLTSFTPMRSLYADRRSQDDASTRYGRLLPSKIQSCSNSNDSLNANASLTYIRSGSAEYISQQYHHSAVAGMSGASADFGVNYQNGHASGLASMHCQQRNRLRGGRFGNGHALNGGQQVPLHSLSSPESAYSTGYSTDGTSPGAIYTPPEYYINMRTGTHYFPKSVNSLAIEAQRYKFGLNKIEEMSPIDPMPKTSFANASGLYKRADSYDMGQGCSNNNGTHHEPFIPLDAPHAIQHPGNVGRHSPLALRNAIVLPTLKGFESPSPRQRCRIRTNPWYLTSEANAPATGNVSAQNVVVFLPPPPPTQPPPTQPPPTAMSTTSDTSTISSSAHSTMTPEALGTPMRQHKSVKTLTSGNASGGGGGGRRELDAASTSSSGKRSCNATTDGRRVVQHSQQTSDNGGLVATGYESTESSSSLTEVENMKRTYTPNTVRRKRAELQAKVGQPLATMLAGVCVVGGSNREPVVSDDDATLNEMMGKFDESYVYEKETDILSSDSDPTDCPSDLDTGQDAGDECDTDELLEIDFIDTSSMQDPLEWKDSEAILVSCYYSSQSPKRGLVRQHDETRASVRSRRDTRHMKNTTEEGSNCFAPRSSSQRRRKRFLKTRKKSAENRTERQHSPHKPRQSRSVGGTPVCLRRQKHITAKNRIYKNSPLTNRSSSLVFTDVRDARRFMTIAESERALLKADLEADVKYRQLIQEAESLLVSMKNSMQSIPRDTPVSSPRRVNPLTNKRVEMLKNCEADTRREQLKQAQQRSLDVGHTEKQQQQQQQQQQQELAAAINRRIDLLRHAPASAPNSPRFSRCSPRKTHLTNFINQNVPPEVPVRKTVDVTKPLHSPQLHVKGRRMQPSPTATPLQERRFRSQSPVSRHQRNGSLQHSQNFESDSESESQHLNDSIQLSKDATAVDAVNHNYLPEFARISRYEEADLRNHNVAAVEVKSGDAVVQWQSGLMHACPQSEPLKRKVYRGSSTFERIKKSFDLEVEIPKQAMLAKIHTLRRRERQNSNPRLTTLGSSQDLQQALGEAFSCGSESAGICVQGDHKKKMILCTIADLKRSLETQSVELNGLNGH